MCDPLSDFHREMIDRLRAVAHEGQVASPGRSGSRVRFVVSAAVCAALTLAGVALWIGVRSSSSAPANREYAITTSADGTVTLLVRDVEGVSAANTMLASLGIRARAVRPAAGCAAPANVVPWPRGSVGSSLIVPTPLANPNVAGSFTIGFQPRLIPAGDTLVLAAQEWSTSARKSTGASVGNSGAFYLVRGKAPACVAPIQTGGPKSTWHSLPLRAVGGNG